MPRDFDSDARTPQIHAFVEIVDCGSCGTQFEGLFADNTRSLSFEDITERPSGSHECPGCGLVFTTEMTGWMLYNEAG